MDSRVWFAILRFYVGIILWGDPSGPRAKPKRRSEVATAKQLRPLRQSE